MAKKRESPMPSPVIAKTVKENNASKHFKAKKKHSDATSIWMKVVVDTLKVTPKFIIAARAAGVHPTTIKEARAKYPEFNRECLEAIEEYKANVLVGVQNKAVELALDGDTRMIEFVLKGFDPRRYDRSKMAINMGGGESGDFVQVETETEKTITVIRQTLVRSREEAEEFKRRQIAKQQTIDEPTGVTNGQENGHGGNGKHNGNGNGKK